MTTTSELPVYCLRVEWLDSQTGLARLDNLRTRILQRVEEYARQQNISMVDALKLPILPEIVEEIPVRTIQSPIPMRIPCPRCHALHIDKPPYDTKVHHTHACQTCGEVWRPALVHTVGVQFLPGFKNP